MQPRKPTGAAMIAGWLSSMIGSAVRTPGPISGRTDAVVLELPEAAWPGLGGELLAALTAAGAFAAFMSTASGLLVSISRTLSYDVRSRRRQREGGGRDRMRIFRNAAVAGMVVPAVLALGARDLDISVQVGWAFALAGGTVASAAIFTTLFAGPLDGAIGALLAQPAMVSVPVAFATIGFVSIRDSKRPRDVDRQMLAMHAPEELGLEALRA
jgi:cation/acetate symporter